MSTAMAAEPRRLKILLSEGSSLSARHTLYSLGGRHTIDLMDPAALCQARFSRFVRRWHRCPSFSKDPQGYLRFLSVLLDREKYDVLIPTHEQVFLLARVRDAVARRVGLALPEFAALERLQSKADFSRLLDELALPQPRYTIVRSRAELDRDWDFPCFIKLAHSTAGGGVRKVDDRKELAAALDEFTQRGLSLEGSETMVQQPGIGVQSTVQAVFQQGRMVAAHCFEARAIGVGGMSMARVSASHPIVLEQMARLGRHVNWHGATFIDYFYDAATGQPQYIEANPRIGETVNAWLSGVNLCEALVQVSLGESVTPPLSPRIGVRTHSGFMILMAKALKGASRGELWRERRMMRRGEDLYADSEDELTRPRDDRLSVIPALAVTAELLLNPSRARTIVKKTVDNYSLPAAATQHIREMPPEAFS